VITYRKGEDDGPGYDEFPVGTLVRLKAPHRFRGETISSTIRVGDIGMVVAPSDGRTFQHPHVVLRVSDANGTGSRKWFDISCLEVFENGPSEEEIAAVFGLKSDAELLADVISHTDIGKHLEQEARKTLAEAIVASPVWRHA
jgi:hypothetical protein